MLDVVVITSGYRRELLAQALMSMSRSRPASHLRPVVVYDRYRNATDPAWSFAEIFAGHDVGASACRNIGASSIPKYRRQKYVMFSDDDAYYCPGWDKAILSLLEALPNTVVSGHAHPYNGSEAREVPIRYREPLVLSAVNLAMSWEVWDKVGFFAEPGGPASSDDVEWCKRAAELGVRFAVTEPQCVLHVGLTSSNGKQLVGYKEMVEQNEKLIQHYGLTGVTWK